MVVKASIRFRVWDGNRMWYPPKKEDYTWRIARTGVLWCCTQFYDETISSKYLNAIPMLSTGVLRDKNGKEVWDGDILEGVHGTTGKPVYVVVIWCQNEGWWGVQSTNGSISTLRELLKSQMGHTYKVAGNIYEDTELHYGVTFHI